MIRYSISTIAALFLLATVSLAPAAEKQGPPPDDKAFKPLFNGKDLSGWKKVGGGATYHIEGETIVGEVGPGSNTFLRTKKTYDDFILKLDVKLEIPSNSGIQFRSHQRDGDGRVFGYQMEIDPSDRAWSGGVYDEAREGWLYPLKDMPKKQAAFNVKGWNEYVIKADGDHIQTWVNGILIADFHNKADDEGFIALQVHAGDKGRIVWRNIRLKELE